MKVDRRRIWLVPFCVVLGGVVALVFFGRGEPLAAVGAFALLTQHAYSAVVCVTVAGFLIELARGRPGPFMLISAVGGFTHMGALALLRRRV